MLRASLARRPSSSSLATSPPKPTRSPRFELVDLADGGLGGRVLLRRTSGLRRTICSSRTAVFDPDAFCVQGKVMDGWESRRRRTAGFDWCVVRLGSRAPCRASRSARGSRAAKTPAARVFAAHIDDGGGAGDDGWIGRAGDARRAGHGSDARRGGGDGGGGRRGGRVV